MTLSVGVPAAHAAIITVNTTADELNSDGDCSLREAIAAANTNLPVDRCPAGTPGPIVDVITFSVTGTITLTMGQLTVTDDLIIDGPGATNLTVSGNNSSRVLALIAGKTLTVLDLTVANGLSLGGSGILNSGTLTVTSSTFSRNSADTSSGFQGGGGILNFGRLTVTSSTFSGNTASGNGAAIANSGPTLTVSTSTFSGNSAAQGGAIDQQSGTLTVTDSTFSRNSAVSFWGGAISSVGGAATIVTGSTFSENSTADLGGGILNFLAPTLTVINSTFSGNSAGNGGGGIHNYGTTTVTNSTFSGNFVSGPFGLGGGIRSSGPLTLRNTIVANSPSGGNCAGVIIDGLGNLQHPGVDCGPTIPSADPLLGPLAANDGPAPDPPDGPTKTHALLPGSPAIDTAVLASCPPTDQRGVARPQGAGCDKGAFELEVALCPRGDDDLDDDGLDDKSEDVFGSLLNDDDSDDDGIRDGNDDGDDDGEDDEDEDDDTDPCPDDEDGDGEDDEDEDDGEDDD